MNTNIFDEKRDNMDNNNTNNTNGLRYEVFSIGNFESFLDYFAKKLADASGTELAEVRIKPHFSFLAKYTETIQPKTVIIEFDYVDRDFLEDYATYHVRSFRDYKKRCIRLLFFSSVFSQDDFNEILIQGETSSFLPELTNSYLGYMVVRPLPRTMIGRTALKTYPNQSESDPNCIRYYPGIFPCKSNLFGIPLSVDSLPFQEQDRSVSACATSALWSALHKVADIFDRPTLSPAEITKLAMQGTSFTGQVFPNNGLTASQISNAIRAIGIETKYIDFTEFTNQKDVLGLKELVYSYLVAGIPIIFAFDLFRQQKNNQSPTLWELYGRHAVTIAGYALSTETHQYNDDTIRIAAHRLQKLYVHDDQTGPFSKMTFEDSNQIQHKGTLKKTLSLFTGWDNEKYNYRAVPVLLLIPLYHKIRIDYPKIREFAYGVDSYIRKLAWGNLTDIWNKNVSWKIELSFLNDYKKTMFQNNDASAEEKVRALTCSLPRFFWNCSLEANGKKAIDFLFDATDISSGDLFVHYVKYQSNFSRGIIKLFENLLSPSQQLISEHSSLRCTLDLILQNYKNRHSDIT